MQRIVLGLDGTVKDRDVVQWTADLAADTGAHVIAAHFVPRQSLWLMAGAQIDSGKYLAELRRHFEDEVLVPLYTRIGAVHLRVDAGEPVHELAVLAEQSGADLVVIGAPDHHAMHDVVFGNFERRLVQRAKVPVVTIPRVSRHMRLVR